MFPFNRIAASFINDGFNVPSIFNNNGLGTFPIQIETGSHTLYGWNIYNPNNYTVFVKFFNTSNSPIIGTDSPVLVLPVAALGNVVFFGSDQYMYFDLSIWLVCVQGYEYDNNIAPDISPITTIQYK